MPYPAVSLLIRNIISQTCCKRTQHIQNTHNISTSMRSKFCIWGLICTSEPAVSLLILNIISHTCCKRNQHIQNNHNISTSMRSRLSIWGLICTSDPAVSLLILNIISQTCCKWNQHIQNTNNFISWVKIPDAIYKQLSQNVNIYVICLMNSWFLHNSLEVSHLTQNRTCHILVILKWDSVFPSFMDLW